MWIWLYVFAINNKRRRRLHVIMHIPTWKYFIKPATILSQAWIVGSGFCTLSSKYGLVFHSDSAIRSHFFCYMSLKVLLGFLVIRSHPPCSYGTETVAEVYRNIYTYSVYFPTWSNNPSATFAWPTQSKQFYWLSICIIEFLKPFWSKAKPGNYL